MRVNKRRHPRVRARGVAANLRAQEVLKTGCLVENISAGGLLVRTEQPLEMGTPVVMDLVRPGMKKLLKLSGRVVGRAENVVGAAAQVPVSGLRIQFDPMPDETNERLSQLLADLGLTADPPAPPPNSAAHGSPLLPASAPQITWAPPPGPDAARAISAEAVRPALTPPPIVPLSSAGTSPPEDARLMVQIRGLLMELGDVQSRLESRERESVDLVSQVERLRLENRELRERLVRAEGQLQERHVKEGTARP